MKTILTIFLEILVLSSGTVTAQLENFNRQYNAGINSESSNQCSKFYGYLPVNMRNLKDLGSLKVCAYTTWHKASVVDLNSQSSANGINQDLLS